MKEHINCPRPGCGTKTMLSYGGVIETHKLPDGWRTCAASGTRTNEASEMSPPAPLYKSQMVM